MSSNTYELHNLSKIVLKYILILSVIFVGIAILPAHASTEFTPFQNISNSPNDSVNPFVVTDGKNIFITWSEFSNANHSADIHFSKSTDGGITFSTPKNISNQHGSPTAPFIHVDESTIFITWTYRYQDDHYSEIYFSKSTDGGITFSDPQKISDATFSYSSRLVTDDKNIFVTWSDITFSNERHYENMEVFFSKSTDGGVTFSSPMNLSNNKEFSSHSSIVTVGKDIFITWQDEPNGVTDIFISKSTDGGVTFSTPKNISNSPDSSVGAKLITDGTNIFVTWFEFHKSIGDIFFSKSTDGGATFSTPINLSKNKENSVVPFMTTDGKDIFITWTDSTTTGSWIVFSKSTDGGITFSDPQKISNENGFSDAPSITTDGKTVFTAWNYRLKMESQYDILFSKSIIDESIINKELSDKVLPLDEPKKVNDVDLKDDSESEIPNYTIGTIEWIDSKPFLGGYGVIKIVDPDMNKNSELVDIFKAKAWSVTDIKGIELDMIETDRDTGIFYIDIEFSSKKSAIQILETSLGDIVTVSYLDSTTPDGQYVELTDTITISQPPPSHKQLELGILPENIKCKDDMELIFKHTDDSPACVNPETKNKLLERGWKSSLN